MAKYDFLKLTRALTGPPVYIEVGHISTMIRWNNNEKTDVYLTGDNIPVAVLETPEQILDLLNFRID